MDKINNPHLNRENDRHRISLISPNHKAYEYQVSVFTNRKFSAVSVVPVCFRSKFKVGMVVLHESKLKRSWGF